MERRGEATVAALIDGTPSAIGRDRALGISTDGRKIGGRARRSDREAAVVRSYAAIWRRAGWTSAAAAVRAGRRQGVAAAGAVSRAGGFIQRARAQTAQRVDHRPKNKAGGPETAERLRHDRTPTPSGAGTAASRADGAESKRRPQLEEGMEETITMHRLRGRPSASHAGEHERDRVGLLHRGDGLPQRKTLAC